MKKSELKKLIKEEISKKMLTEGKDLLSPLYNQGYSAGDILNPIIADLIKTKGFEQTEKYIKSLLGEPTYDMSSPNPFGV